MQSDLDRLRAELSEKMDEAIERVKVQNSRIAKLENRAQFLEHEATTVADRVAQTDRIIYGDPTSDHPGLIGIARDVKRMFKGMALIGVPVLLYIIYEFFDRLGSAM